MNTHGSLPNEYQNAHDPHLCRVCRRPFLVPLSIVPLVSQHAYVVELQCTNCEDATVTLLDETDMEHLDRELDRQSGRLRHALAGLAAWDQRTMMPPGGGPARALVLATLERLAHERATGDEIGEWLDALESETGELDDVDR